MGNEQSFEKLEKPKKCQCTSELERIRQEKLFEDLRDDKDFQLEKFKLDQEHKRNVLADEMKFKILQETCARVSIVTMEDVEYIYNLLQIESSCRKCGTKPKRLQRKDQDDPRKVNAGFPTEAEKLRPGKDMCTTPHSS